MNPTDDEVEGYINLPILPMFRDLSGGAHDAVNGCLANAATKQRLCGALDLDTGAPGISVVGADVPQAPWATETPAAIELADGQGRVRVFESFVIGRRYHASRLTSDRRDGVRATMIETGLTPYFAYSVLYDPDHGTIGFKARETRPQDPQPKAAS